MGGLPRGDDAGNISRVLLLPVNSRHGGDVLLLYQLLQERTPEQSISLKSMPTFTEHCEFVRGHPYTNWYVIYAPYPVGAIYLSKQREIGIAILNEHQRKGYGAAAVLELMRAHPGRFLANINPHNSASIAFWKRLGFEQIQVTYAKS
jgi:RimJ/RimL family protein N-acetyltransferase